MTEPDERKFNGGDIEPQLSAFIQHLLEIADCSLTSPILNKDTPVKKTKNKKRNEVESIEEQAKNLRMGKHHVEVYAPNLIKAIKTISDLGRPSVSEYGLECLWNVLAGAFLIGSRGVVTEGAKEFYRPEIESEHGSPGGKKSGEKRLAKAEDGWRAKARMIAKTIRASDQNISKANLALEIAWASPWTAEMPCRPSMLPKLISKWEKTGKLPRRRPANRTTK